MNGARARRRFGALHIIVAAFLSAAGGNAALAQSTLELELKATYLYKFAPFVDWPAAVFASPAAPLTVCVVGTDPFGALLDQAVAGQRVADHPIVVKRIAAASPGCHIAYIGGTEPFVGEALAGFRTSPVLTVTDMHGGAVPHGIVNFVIEANHVRFDIDEVEAAQSGLVISSKLLGLARAVRPRG